MGVWVVGLVFWVWRDPAVDAGWFQRTDLPSAIASDSQLPHGGQCGSQESNAEVKLASLGVFFFSRRSFWKSGLRTGGWKRSGLGGHFLCYGQWEESRGHFVLFVFFENFFFFFFLEINIRFCSKAESQSCGDTSSLRGQFGNFVHFEKPGSE